ncbi:uncharacterized protein LOC142163217 [Nicotiana tabacum]|uniref:Uncharacterized protein LOC142163217 n=1 Tax=Nicotiana tabacum TaxID=4097 RepID=A0AC58RV19_TOBAC
MSYIIPEAQTGFISRRRIADNIILAHELVKSYSGKHISLRCMIKVELQKSYDSVEWAYREHILEGLVFPDKFIKWLMSCVRTVNHTILHNGKTIQPFNALKDKRFKYHPRCGKLHITHLSYADDLVLFARGDTELVKRLHACFLTFSATFGLQANLAISAIYSRGMENKVKEEDDSQCVSAFFYRTTPCIFL